MDMSAIYDKKDGRILGFIPTEAVLVTIPLTDEQFSQVRTNITKWKVNLETKELVAP